MLLGALCALIAITWAIVALRRAPRPVRMPLATFLLFYVITTAVGASLLGIPVIRQLWALTFPRIDARWLAPAEGLGYWLMVWGPLLVTSAAALYLYPRVRRPILIIARTLGRQVDVLPPVIVATAMCVYCFVNLGLHGYLGVSPLSADLLGVYRLNIQLRAEMADVLGTLHFAFVYMGMPAIAILAFYNAVRTRRRAWLGLFVTLSALLAYLYVATLTKANILIYGIEVVVAAQTLGVIRARGLLVAVVTGTLVLSGLTALLSGSSPLDLALTGYNIVFREASDVPFYLAIFPEQIPFVGIDVGLGGFGIGPTIPTNQIVSNFMLPHDTWAQGAAPAAAHVMAYAQGGYVWAFVTMMLVGLWVAVTGQLKRVAHNGVVFSGFVGAVTTCYYLSQADFVGAFNVAYGYRWWLVSLLLVLAVQRVLELALREDVLNTRKRSNENP